MEGQISALSNRYLEGYFFFLMIRRPPSSTPFPHPTPFRSRLLPSLRPPTRDNERPRTNAGARMTRVARRSCRAGGARLERVVQSTCSGAVRTLDLRHVTADRKSTV